MIKISIRLLGICNTMTEKNDKVWQLDKKDVIPICNNHYKLLKDKDVFKYIGNHNYRGLHSEEEYRSEWQDQEYCFFCDIYDTIKDSKI